MELHIYSLVRISLWSSLRQSYIILALSYIAYWSTVHSLILRSEVLTAVVMKTSFVWDITLCSLLKMNRRFEGTYRFHLQA
jgi:hypothetical protein